MQISPVQFLFAGRVEARTDYAQTLVPQTLERLSRPRKYASSSRVAARVGFQGGGLLGKPRLPTRVHVNRLSGTG